MDKVGQQLILILHKCFLFLALFEHLKQLPIEITESSKNDFVHLFKHNFLVVGALMLVWWVTFNGHLEVSGFW